MSKKLAQKMEDLKKLKQQIKSFETSDEYRQYVNQKQQLEMLEIDITDEAMDIYRKTGHHMPHPQIGIDMRPFVVINPFAWKND